MRCELTARAPGVVARGTPAGARCGAEFEADVVRGEARLARGPADARNSPAGGRAAVDSRYERRALSKLLTKCWAARARRSWGSGIQ